jgi:hypothetical protein
VGFHAAILATGLDAILLLSSVFIMFHHADLRSVSSSTDRRAALTIRANRIFEPSHMVNGKKKIF